IHPTEKPLVKADLTRTEIPAPAIISSPLTQKLSDTFKIPTTKTEHTVENISKPAPAAYPPKADPYRLPPEE
ncbi:hypothetical protein K2P96_00860, partial [Patescibacteria group bacterium]|nr:hypothetical protein [Patescibacteria group bacterium]